MKKIKIVETALRDAPQSLIATRMKIDDMLPILDKMDDVGYEAVEVWGGATFDTCLRYLDEDPWERLRTFRKHFKNTKLQMLLRGQNLLGYRNYPDDVVDEFIKKSVENGIDIIRIFDALNDTRNLKTSIDSTKKYGAHAQAAIAYTTSPVHDVDYYLNLAKDMEKMGADSICIKDMSGILMPGVARELVLKLKKNISVPIEVHSHFTSGIANITYLEAVKAGADIVDLAVSPFGNGTSQPAEEPMLAVFEDAGYKCDLNMEALFEVSEYFKVLKNKYTEEGLLNPKVLDVDVKTLKYQVPGGMLSNLMAQLKSQKAEDKFDAVLGEVPNVRRDLGYPPLVTPLSQMVGTQSVFNVISGERYKIVPKEIKDYVRGLYGKSPVPISDEIKKIIIGDEDVISERPADLLEPKLDFYRNEIKEYIKQDEDVLSYALFPETALEFFKNRDQKKVKVFANIEGYDIEVIPI